MCFVYSSMLYGAFTLCVHYASRRKMQNKPKAKIIIFTFYACFFVLRFFFRFVFRCMFLFILSLLLLLFLCITFFSTFCFVLVFEFASYQTLKCESGLMLIWLLLLPSVSSLTILSSVSSSFILFERGRKKKMPIRHQQKQTFLSCAIAAAWLEWNCQLVRLMSTLTMPMPMQNAIHVWVREAGDFTMFKAIGIRQSKMQEQKGAAERKKNMRGKKVKKKKKKRKNNAQNTSYKFVCLCRIHSYIRSDCSDHQRENHLEYTKTFLSLVQRESLAHANAFCKNIASHICFPRSSESGFFQFRYYYYCSVVCFSSVKIRCYSFVKFLCLSFGFSSKLHFCRLAHTLALYSAHASTHTAHHHHHPPPAAATLIGIETDSTTTTTSIREQQSGCQPASIPRNSSKTFIASQLYGIEIVAATNR